MWFSQVACSSKITSRYFVQLKTFCARYAYIMFYGMFLLEVIRCIHFYIDGLNSICHFPPIIEMPMIEIEIGMTA